VFSVPLCTLRQTRPPDSARRCHAGVFAGASFNTEHPKPARRPGVREDLDDGEPLVLPFRQAAVELEHLRETDHRIERRAQFVAHAGEEGALGAVGDLGALLGRLQFERARAHQLFQLLVIAVQLFAPPAAFDRDAGHVRRQVEQPHVLRPGAAHVAVVHRKSRRAASIRVLLGRRSTGCDAQGREAARAPSTRAGCGRRRCRPSACNAAGDATASARQG
jgi:hypothetical protein